MQLNIDNRRNAVIGGDEIETIEYSAKHFIKCAKEAIRFHGCFYVALSGGSTPKKIYQTLAEKHRTDIDWAKVFLFWSDERAVGPEDPDSNYKMAMDSGLKTLPIPANQIFRMEGEGDISLHAESYERIIQKVLDGRHFDLIMLGIGEDGHTASLFPNTLALSENSRLVVANHVPQKNTWRMTFTFKLINSAHNIVLYALGKSKLEILKKILFSDTLPASKVGSELHPALYVLDKESGAFIQL